MSKDSLIELRGKVLQMLPNANFRVELENSHQIIAYTSGKMRKNRIKVLVGDEVTIEMNLHDLTKGRIMHRHSSSSNTQAASTAAPSPTQDDSSST